MASPEQQPTTIAILGPNTLSEHVLSHLLEEKGYAVRLLKAPRNGASSRFPEGGSLEEVLGGVEAVLLWPGPSLTDAAREAFVGAMRSTPATDKIPLIALPSSLEIALQDEMAEEVPLARQFDYLMRILEDVLASPAGSVGLVDLSDYPEKEEPVYHPPRRTGREATRQLDLLPIEPYLPPGYRLDRSDPEVLVVRDAQDSVVARFSARGADLEAIEEEAWRAHRERSRPA